MADTNSFTSYIPGAKTEYKYVLKFAVKEMTSDMVDALEACLARYDLVSASAFRKTPIQSSPLDFPNIQNIPVFICDLVLKYPASLSFLQTHICNAVKISPQELVVYSENDPRQIETDLFLDRNSDEYKSKYKPVVGTEYPADEKPAYGEQFNISFLKELNSLSKQYGVLDGMTVDNTTQHEDTYNDKTNAGTPVVGMFGRVTRTELRRGKV